MRELCERERDFKRLLNILSANEYPPEEPVNAEILCDGFRCWKGYKDKCDKHLRYKELVDDGKLVNAFHGNHHFKYQCPYCKLIKLKRQNANQEKSE